jgi:Fur family ferric uptake transcriptional regulator
MQSPSPAADASPPLALTVRQQRLLDELGRSDDELSGQELHARLRHGPDAMGLATVYRNLRHLQQRGLVRSRHLPSGEALFAPTERDRHHLTCVDCGFTLPLADCPVHGLPSASAELLNQDLARNAGRPLPIVVKSTAGRLCCRQLPISSRR